MQIKNHITIPSFSRPSPNHGGLLSPKFIVMHYTAGWTAESAVGRMIDPTAKVSAHVCIDVDGAITQLVPFNVVAWHAGPSEYAGYNGLNNHAIGIEIVNVGFLKKVSSDVYIDAYGEKHVEDRGKLKGVSLIEAPNTRVGGGMYYWPSYTVRQLNAVEELTKLLIEQYTIIDIVSHEEIDTRHWKTDPGPAFPMQRYKALLPESPHTSGDAYEVTASTLKQRSGPGTSFGENGPQLSSGTVVSIMSKNGDWVKIDHNSWVHSGYLRRIE